MEADLKLGNDGEFQIKVQHTSKAKDNLFSVLFQRYHRIPFHHLPFPVNGKAFPAGWKGDAAEVTPRSLPGNLGTSQRLFKRITVVCDHARKDSGRLCHIRG